MQNYCNLTLDGVNLDGTQSSSCGYVLSNNFGNTVVTGKTTITAGTGKVAFDLWYGMSDTYKDGVSITFDKNFTGTVTGKVEYGAQQQTDGWEGKTSLSIQGGTFNTQFVASSGNDMKQAKDVYKRQGRCNSAKALPARTPPAQKTAAKAPPPGWRPPRSPGFLWRANRPAHRQTHRRAPCAR